MEPKPEPKPGPRPEPEEVILAEEQAVVRRGIGAAKDLEGVFSIGEIEGTLVLTNKRLMFVTMGEVEEDLPEPTVFNPFGKLKLYYTDVEDLKSIPADPENLFVPISTITSAKGQKGNHGSPRLEVKWLVGGKERGAEFSQRLTGKRTKNLDDWARTMDRLRKGKLPLVVLPKAPGLDTLEGKVLRVLSDLQEKGVLVIEHRVEDVFKIELDPERVQAAANKLVTQGLAKRRRDPSGDNFFQKRSPLGDDDLSA